MQRRYLGLLCLAACAALTMLFAFPALAETQQNDTVNGTLSAPPMAELGNISSATVTLYYYDQSTGEKGAMVPMPDNPQQVGWDASRAAPGMYTFAHVPAGKWYYLEANNGGHKWYAVFYMTPGEGTHTANVHIPPFQPVNTTIEITPTPVASPNWTATPQIITPTPPAATPGMTGLVALMGLIIAAIVFIVRK